MEHPGLPQELFAQRQSGFSHDFAIDAVGQRLVLIVSPDVKDDATPITVVLNWAAGLSRK